LASRRLVLLVVVLLAGCAAFQTGASYYPQSINEVCFRDRAVSKADRDVRVTVAVPTNEEIEAFSDVDRVNREIQPVWVKIENHSTQNFYLPSAGTDPNYFSPLEAVYAVRGLFDV
jgi:hypothetical protein